MSCKIITLNLYGEIITLTPIKLYRILEEGITHSKVIMYEIKSVNSKGTEIKAEIPYYISDGMTNQVRANMIFPFMSFNMEASKANSPYNTDRRNGLLFKYNIGHNIRLKTIDDWIREQFFHMYGVIEGSERLKKLDNSSECKTVRVPSLLPRLTNLLDYIISILSSDIYTHTVAEIERDIRCYRPNKADKYNINACDTSTEINDEDTYKIFLLRALENQIHYLLKWRIFEVSDKILDPIDKSRVDFNKELSICLNLLSYSKNVENYVIISIKFHLKIKAYLTQLLDEPDLLTLSRKLLFPVKKKDLDFVTMFNNLLEVKTVFRLGERPDNALTETIVNHWNAKCTKQTGGKDNSIPIKQIENVNTTIENLIKYNDIRAVNGHTTTKLILKNLYEEYKIKYLNLKKLL